MSPSCPVPAHAMAVPEAFQQVVCPVAGSSDAGHGEAPPCPASAPATPAMQASTLASTAAASPSVAHPPGLACLSAISNALANAASHRPKSAVPPCAFCAYSSARHFACAPAARFFRTSQRCATLWPAIAPPLQDTAIATSPASPALHPIVLITRLLVFRECSGRSALSAVWTAIELLT